jgi:hypothetical protein
VEHVQLEVGTRSQTVIGPRARLGAEALAASDGVPGEREHQALAQEVQAAVQRMPWGQLTTRFFAQGG